MSAYARNLKFDNFYKLYFPLTFNLEIGTEASLGESVPLFNLIKFKFIKLKTYYSCYLFVLYTITRIK